MRRPTSLLAPSGLAYSLMAVAVATACLAGAAIAAQPGAPPAPAAGDVGVLLTREAQGVVGSGDRLSLRVGQGEAARNIAPGQPYRDGWVLQSLTPTEVALAKDGAVVRVGLNPSGAPAQAAPQGAPPSITVVGGRIDAATMDRYRQQTVERMGERYAEIAQQAARAGLTPAEFDRFMAYSQIATDFVLLRLQTAPPGTRPTPTIEDWQRLLPPDDLKEWHASATKMSAAMGVPGPPPLP